MKLKVLKTFSDKNTGELYTKDLTIEVSNERGKELLAHPLDLVENVDENPVMDKIIDEVVEEFKEEQKKKTTRKKKAQ